jgi:endogenous inhibitor of DNA gyrase (YacG/DUF329 family)
MDPAWRPFCSERCRLADLGRWLSEDYRVPDDTPLEIGSDSPEPGENPDLNNDVTNDESD